VPHSSPPSGLSRNVTSRLNPASPRKRSSTWHCRQAGLYDSAEDADWYRTECRRLGEEITALKALPERKPGMRLVPTGRTIAEEWDAADNARRREMLAEFEVRVVLHPTGHEPRVAITGMEIAPDVCDGIDRRDA
jgi:hypothetical protein